MNEKEIWKPIEGFEDYHVSTSGNIWSDKRRIYLQPEITRLGYERICLYKNKTRNRFLIHVLVAKAFIPNPENKPEVNHIKGIKGDNRATQLEWSTKSENHKDAFVKGFKNIQGDKNPFYGKKHSKEARKKMADHQNKLIADANKG